MLIIIYPNTRHHYRIGHTRHKKPEQCSLETRSHEFSTIQKIHKQKRKQSERYGRYLQNRRQSSLFHQGWKCLMRSQAVIKMTLCV